MIVKAWGTVNGEQITLTRRAGDVWTADVPWREDGSYAVELYAEDEAGNVGYCCTMLFVITGCEMRAYVMKHGYDGTVCRNGPIPF